jgi:hypothetical protein
MTNHANLYKPLAFLLFLLMRPVEAQWPSSPAQHYPIFNSAQDEMEPGCVTDGRGGAYVNAHIGAGELAEIRLHRVRKNATKAWSAAGLMITDKSPNAISNNVKMVSDGNGGVVFFWLQVGDAVNKADIYAQRYDSTGTPQWISNRIICQDSGDQTTLSVSPDSLGGVILTWADVQSGKYRLSCERITFDGKLLWGNGKGVVFASEQSGNWQPSSAICADGKGGVFAGWSGTTGSDPANLYARHLYADGTQSAIFAIDSSINLQSQLRIIADQVGGLIAVWQSDDPDENNADIYANRFNANGTPLWGNRKVVCSEAGIQKSSNVVSDRSGGCVVIFKDNRTEGGTQYDIWGQRLMADGSKAWSTAGIPVLVGSSKQMTNQIMPDGLGGMILSAKDLRANSLGEVNVQRLDRDGHPLWNGTTGVCVASQASAKDPDRIVLTTDGSQNGTGVLIFWDDARTGNRDVYGARVSPSGTLGGMAEIVLPPAAPSNLVAHFEYLAHNIELNWLDNSSNETQFHLERKTGNGEYVLLSLVNGNSTSYSDATISPFTDYSYRVRAENAAGQSAYAYSTAIHASLKLQTPTNLKTTAVSPTQVQLFWQNVETISSRIQIERKANSGNFLLLATTATGSQMYLDSSVLTGYTYTYRLKAVQDWGASDYSVESAVTLSLSGFVQIPIVFPLTESGCFAWGDYDNDDDLDVLLIGSTGTSNLTTLYNNNNGSFLSVTSGLPLRTSGGYAKWGDYDRNGYLDPLISGTLYTGATPSNILYRNDAGQFSITSALFLPLEFGVHTFADADNDGDLDVFMSGFANKSNIFRIFLNELSQFTSTGSDLIAAVGENIDLADYDNDGDNDMLYMGSSGPSTSYVKVYKNLNGTFSETPTMLSQLIHGTALWVDYNNDGHLDIFQTGSAQNTKVARLLKNENYSFIENGINLNGLDDSAASWGDYDNDGDMDLLVAGDTGSGLVCRIYRNDGTGFTDAGITLPGVRFGQVSWLDYDNDGALDIFLIGSGASGSVTCLYRNTFTNKNTAPSVPSHLVATCNGSTVQLRWDKSSDAQTPAAALSYNIRIGSSPGGFDIVSPMANPVSGYRRLPGMGNTSLGTSWQIKNLPHGTFYWSVQAIDNGGKSSAFSPEQSFSNILAPAAPSELSAKALSDSKISLSWHDNSDNETGFIIERKSGAGAFMQLVQRPQNSIAHIDSNLTAETTFTYRIKAIHSIGSSAYSNESTVMTLKAAQPLARIIIQPACDTLAISQTSHLAAEGRTAGNTIIAVSPAWSVSNNIGVVAPDTGRTVTFTALHPGYGYITAHSGLFADSSLMIVGAKGDVNKSLALDVPDVIITLRMIVHLALPPIPPGHLLPDPFELWAADYDASGGVNEADALFILRGTLQGINKRQDTSIRPEDCMVVRLGEPLKVNDGSVKVPLLIMGDGQVFAAGMDLAYNPKAKIMDISAAVFSSLLATNTEQPGSVSISMVNGNGLIGQNGAVVWFTFNLEHYADCGLAIESVRLYDAGGKPIQAEIAAITSGAYGDLPNNVALYNFPNPFNAQTSIYCHLDRPAPIRLSIYNRTGQLVRELYAGYIFSNRAQILWDGKDGAGVTVPSGIYFCRMIANGKSVLVEKMVLMK